MPNGLRCAVQVTAGLIVDRPMPQYSKQWTFDSETYRKMREGDIEAGQLWDRVMKESREYTEALENPGVVNWVLRSWIWL